MTRHRSKSGHHSRCKILLRLNRYVQQKWRQGSLQSRSQTKSHQTSRHAESARFSIDASVQVNTPNQTPSPEDAAEVRLHNERLLTVYAPVFFSIPRVLS